MVVVSGGGTLVVVVVVGAVVAVVVEDGATVVVVWRPSGAGTVTVTVTISFWTTTCCCTTGFSMMRSRTITRSSGDPVTSEYPLTARATTARATGPQVRASRGPDSRRRGRGRGCLGRGVSVHRGRVGSGLGLGGHLGPSFLRGGVAAPEPQANDALDALTCPVRGARVDHGGHRGAAQGAGEAGPGEDKKGRR